MRRSSSALGVRPTPYVCDCAIAGLARKFPTSSGIATTPSALIENFIGELREAIAHAPVFGYFPGHDAVVEAGHAVVPLERYFPPIGDLFSLRLPLPDVVGSARHDRRLAAIPLPGVSESNVRHALWRILELGAIPALAAIGGYFDHLDSAAAGPRQPAD